MLPSYVVKFTICVVRFIMPHSTLSVALYMAEEFEHDFVVEYFKEMRAEINLRVTTHSNYVVSKIVACGAILSFLLTNESNEKIAAYGVILVPLIAMLYDVMIAKNVRNIHRIGMFIRDELEPLVPSLTFWESRTGQRSVKDRCYDLWDVSYLALFTLATVGCTFLLLINGKVAWYITLTIMLLLLLIFLWSVCFMYQCFAYFEPSPSESQKEEEESITTIILTSLCRAITTLNEPFRRYLADYTRRERQAEEAMAVVQELRGKFRVGRQLTRDEMNER